MNISQIFMSCSSPQMFSVITSGLLPPTLCIITYYRPPHKSRYSLHKKIPTRTYVGRLPEIMRPFLKVIFIACGPGSVVGITTAYGLDSPGIECRWGRDFPHMSRPSLRPTQPPVKWVPGLSGVTLRPRRDTNPSPPSKID